MFLSSRLSSTRLSSTPRTFALQVRPILSFLTSSYLHRQLWCQPFHSVSTSTITNSCFPSRSRSPKPDWIRLAADISLNYASFDGFLILHGTDTMAFSASALSFLLEDLVSFSSSVASDLLVLQLAHPLFALSIPRESL